MNNNFIALRRDEYLDDYAELAKPRGGWSERVAEPGQIVSTHHRAYKTTQDGEAVLPALISSRFSIASRFKHDRH